MGRRKGFVQTLVQAQQAAEKRRLAQMKEQARMQSQAAKAAEKARKEYEIARAADQKERQRLYIESRLAQVALSNEELVQQIQVLERILSDAIERDPFIDLRKLKEHVNLAPFNPKHLAVPETPPQRAMFVPNEPTGLQKLLPGAKEKYAQQLALSQQSYQQQLQAHAAREAQRIQELAKLKAQYDHYVQTEQQKVAQQNKDIEAFQHELDNHAPQAVVEYFTMVLDSSWYPDTFPRKAKLAFVAESRQLVVEFDLPSIEVIPEVASYKYIKPNDEITKSMRSQAQIRSLYTSLIAQITLKTLYEVFKADRMKNLETLVFNGYVESVNRGTGQIERTCIVTVRTSRDIFLSLNLSQVDPAACLHVLNASVSKNPSELAPVRPVLEFSMVDPRFIEETDVLSGLDQRPNLMELTPGEFESLITNLFQKMGLETRQTQASRDGGVDCVAFDPRPIFGGKVVIQAKRYKNTVGVSAVRDLYGTVMNEGASKGILITTSGYGKASYEFAEGKPLELLSGSNLLYLLKEHAAIEAKIEIPDGWKDPRQDED